MQAAAISEHEDRIIKDTDGESYLPVSINEPTEFELFFRIALDEYRYELIVRKEVIEY